MVEPPGKLVDDPVVSKRVVARRALISPWIVLAVLISMADCSRAGEFSRQNLESYAADLSRIYQEFACRLEPGALIGSSLSAEELQGAWFKALRSFQWRSGKPRQGYMAYLAATWQGTADRIEKEMTPSDPAVASWQELLVSGYRQAAEITAEGAALVLQAEGDDMDVALASTHVREGIAKNSANCGHLSTEFAKLARPRYPDENSLRQLLEKMPIHSMLIEGTWK